MSVAETVRIPAWVSDFNSFRQWARSEDFPEFGCISHLRGEIWVDLSMEKLWHNMIKTQYAAVLTLLVQTHGMGHFLGDRMLLSNEQAGLSTEPDGLFISKRSLKRGRVVLAEGDESIEVVGTPDMVLEVVSKSSVEKDTVVLADLYWQAGITEYWLVDAREEEATFDILRHGTARYVATRRQAGWVKSNVFGKSFRLTREMDEDGVSEFHLEIR